MATYAIGDVQGCYDPLQRLLEKIRFDPASDRLWFAGDLINRGPQSLDTLHFVKSLGDAAISVLGNHDIHLLALYYGLRPKEKDPTLIQVLESSDIDELIGWLQKQPLIHLEDSYALVHAGIHPQWSIAKAKKLAAEVEEKLVAVHDKKTMTALYGPTTGDWKSAKHSEQRLCYALNVFTRMRFCTRDAIPDYSHSCAPGDQPEHLVPWFEVSKRVVTDTTIIFGHWAAMGVKIQHGICALDSGCVWGNTLTAFNLHDKSIHQVPCKK